MPSDRLERMRRNPVDDWQIGDVEAVCREFGILFRHGKGSHSQVKHPAAREILTIPSRRPIKPVYIHRLVRYIEDHAGAK